MGWPRAVIGSPFEVWKTPEDIETAFRAEAEDFADDPELALYWVMHFGLCDDPRYAEVAAMVRAQRHDSNHDRLRMALAFFDATGIEYDIDLTPRYNPRGEDNSRLFMLRRADLLSLTYAQSYRGGGALDPLWHSVSLYRRGDDRAIIRMRWLRNNLAKFDLWDALRARLDDADSDDIPFIAYARVFQPGRPGTAALADALVAEVLETRPTWSSRYGAFGKVVLHDIRDHVDDRQALLAAAEIVFEGDRGNPQFSEILASMGEEGFGDAAQRAKLAAFEGLFEGIRNLVSEGAGRVPEVMQQSDVLLGALDPGELSYFVGACTQSDATKVLLRHVLLRDAPDREAHIVSLVARAALADHELGRFFGQDHPPLVTAPDSAVARALLKVLELPQTAFASDHKRKRAVDSVCDMLRAVVHAPDLFDPVISLIGQSDNGVVPARLLAKMFPHRTHAASQPLAQLSEDQAARLMTVALAHAHENTPDFRTGLRLVAECAAHHPATISDPEAPLFKDVVAFTQIPDTAFRNPLDRADALELVFGVTRAAVQVPAVFDRLMGLIAADTPQGTAQAIFSGAFTSYEEAPSGGPVSRLGPAQVERMLDAALDCILRTPARAKAPLRAIKASAVPTAKDWLTRKLADRSVFERLEAADRPSARLSRDLEDALEQALERMDDQACK